MEAASRLRITLKLLLSLDLTSHLKIGANTIVIVVRVYEIPPGIVGRVNIDCFVFSVIALLQELEAFEVVTFNQEIARPVPLDAFIRPWQERAGCRRQCDLSPLTARKSTRPNHR